MSTEKMKLIGIVVTVLGVIVTAIITGGFGLWSASISNTPPEKNRI